MLNCVVFVIVLYIYIYIYELFIGKNLDFCYANRRLKCFHINKSFFSFLPQLIG